MKRIYLVVRTSYDVFVKPTYALLKKERTDILRLIVRSFFVKLAPGYPHPVSSELENIGIRVAVGDCSVSERRRWCPPYQTGKTLHVHAKHY